MQSTLGSDPTTSDGESLDEFHLFHFDKTWFLELITERFGIIEEINIDNFSHFYRFLHKMDTAAGAHITNGMASRVATDGMKPFRQRTWIPSAGSQECLRRGRRSRCLKMIATPSNHRVQI